MHLDFLNLYSVRFWPQWLQSNDKTNNSRFQQPWPYDNSWFRLWPENRQPKRGTIKMCIQAFWCCTPFVSDLSGWQVMTKQTSQDFSSHDLMITRDFVCDPKIDNPREDPLRYALRLSYSVLRLCLTAVSAELWQNKQFNISAAMT